MPCPKSPEGGFHRYRLPGAGRNLPGTCIYCGQERVFRPLDDPATHWTTSAEKRNTQPDATEETGDA
jgi:hypothetical protein